MNRLSQTKGESKKKQFKYFLKEGNDLKVELRAGSRLFNSRGPATANEHGLQWMRDELVVPRDRRLMLNGADDVQYCRQTLLGQTSISTLFVQESVHQHTQHM